MKKYAIIQLGGKQFKITEGLEFRLERQEKLDIGVLLYFDGKNVEIGEPLLTGITVKAKIIGEEKAPKIRVARFRAKSRHRRVKGHKQPMSVVKVESISKGAKAASPKPTKVKKTTTSKKASKKTIKKGSKK